MLSLYRSFMGSGYLPIMQVATGDCPHILFYGSPGVGKKTLVIGLLHQIYGDGVEKVNILDWPSGCSCLHSWSTGLFP